MSNYSFVCIWKYNRFLILALYPVALLNLLILNTFCTIFGILNVDDYIVCNKDSLFPICIPLCSCLTLVGYLIWGWKEVIMADILAFSLLWMEIMQSFIIKYAVSCNFSLFWQWIYRCLLLVWSCSIICWLWIFFFIHLFICAYIAWVIFPSISHPLSLPPTIWL
jgi:hypothetical protein